MKHKNKIDSNKKYPNIYMLIIDTYPSQKNLDKYLEFYNENFISYLKSTDYDVKEDIMATMCCTWHSFNAIFSYDFEDRKKDFNQYNEIEGWHKRKVIHQLLDRGYGVYSAYGISNSNDLASPIIVENLKTKENQSADYNYVRGFYAKYVGSALLLPNFLYKIFTNLDKNLVSYVDKNVLLNQVKAVQKTANNRPFFMLGFTDVLAYDVLCDNTFRKPNSESTIKLLECANDIWKLAIEYIQKNDPNSIVVIMGDHGWPGTDRMRIFNRVHWKKKGDNFIKGQGLFFAMKWNQACQRFKGFEAHTPVNLFKYMMSCIDDQEIPNKLIKNEYVYKNDSSMKKMFLNGKKLY